MGAWGVALFSDDLACDVRDDYRAALTDGLTAEAARDRVLNRFAAALQDAEEGPLVWLALAATAWDLGRLDPETRDRALAVITTGEGVQRWEEAGLGAPVRGGLAHGSLAGRQVNGRYSTRDRPAGATANLSSCVLRVVGTLRVPS